MEPYQDGNYGEFGGVYLPEGLASIMADLAAKYSELKADPTFQNQLRTLYREYANRPSLLQKFTSNGRTSTTPGPTKLTTSSVRAWWLKHWEKPN